MGALQGFVYRAGAYGLGYYRDDAAEDADLRAAAALLREFEAVRAARGGALMLPNPLLNGVATGTAPHAATIAAAAAADGDAAMATGDDDGGLDAAMGGGGNGGGRYLNQYTITLRMRISSSVTSAGGASAAIVAAMAAAASGGGGGTSRGGAAALGVRALLASPRRGELGANVTNLVAVDAHGVVGVHGVFAGAVGVAAAGHLMGNTLALSGAVVAQASGRGGDEDVDLDADDNGGWHDVTLSVNIRPPTTTGTLPAAGGGGADAVDEEGGIAPTRAAFATTYVNGMVHTRLQLSSGADAAWLLSTIDGPLALGDRLAIFGASGSTAAVADMSEATLIARSMNDREVFDAVAAARRARAAKRVAATAAASLGSGASARDVDTLHDRASTPEAAVERALTRVGRGRRGTLTAAARHIVVAALKEVRAPAAARPPLVALFLTR